MAASSRANLNTLYQRLHSPSPVYECSPENGSAQGWTCVLKCAAVLADKTGGGVGRPEETYTATEATKKEACAVAASQALEGLASCGISLQDESKLTLLEAIQQAVKVRL